MEDTEDDSCGHNTLTTTPVQTVHRDVDDQSAPPTSPGKPEVDMRSPREFVTSPEAAADASPRANKAGVTRDLPASPIGAVSEQEREQASVEQTVPKCSEDSPYRYPESYDVTEMTSSYFGESHVNRLQSFVNSVAAVDEATATTSLSRGRLAADQAVIAPGSTDQTTLASCSNLRKPATRPAVADEPLDLSVKHPGQRPNPTSSVGELPFPLPVVPPLFPLFACRESWIAHWAALAAASLQHSLLFPALAVTGADTTSGPGWMRSSSPRSSSSLSSPGGTVMAEELRRTALTAMESFVESSFKPRQQQQQQQQQQRQRLIPASHDLSHAPIIRKRRRHLGAEVTSSGDENGGSHDEKRKRTETNSSRADSVKRRSASPRSDDLSPSRDDASEKRSEVMSKSTPEVNGEGEYLSCSTRYDGQDGANEHPLVSLEKFVGVSTPLFRSAPSSATAFNGFSSPACRTPLMTDGKTQSADVAVTSASKYGGDSAQEAATSRSMLGDGTSGSLGRGFTTALSLLCCNL